MSQSFMNQIKAGAIESWHKYQILPSLVGSQAAHESAYGASGLSLPPNNNLFGIKASPDWTGDTVWMWTNEHVGGSTQRVYAEFRKYSSWSDSVEDHAAFFTNTAWRKENYKRVVGEKDYKKAATAVREAGYATDPAYTSKIIRIMEQYNLQEWDQEAFSGAGGAVGESPIANDKTVGGSLLNAGRNKAKELTITVVGDSLGVGTEPILKQMNWLSDNYSNYGSRQWTHGTEIYDALVQLQSIINNNQLNEYVVMILGTNRGVNDSEIKRAVDMIGPSKKLILVDTASEVVHRDKVSIAYKKASESYPNVFYVDWSSLARQNISSWYYADGANGTRIHMNATGYQKHAEYITQAVYEVANTNWTAPNVPKPPADNSNSVIDIRYIDYKDKKFISPPGESAIYNEGLNEQFGFRSANGEVMWIEHVIEVSTTDESEMLAEGLRYMEEHSNPSAQYTVKLKSLPNTISIGDTGIFVDHQFNPPLYIEARVLEITTSDTDSNKDSVVVGNVRELTLQNVSDLIAMQEQLQQTRDELLYEYYENEPVLIEVETTNGLILSEKGYHREKSLGEISTVTITENGTYTLDVDDPRDKYRNFILSGTVLDNILITETELDLSLVDEFELPIESGENPQGDPVPDLLNEDRITRELITKDVTADFVDGEGNIIFTAQLPLHADSTFEYAVIGQNRIVKQVVLHGISVPLTIENIVYLEKSQTSIETADNTQAIVRLKQRGLDVTNRFNNYQWTRVSSSPASDGEWNDTHKFWTANHLTLYISDIHDNESVFICKVFNEDWSEVVNSIGITATRAQSGLSAYQLWLNAGNVGTEADYIEYMRGFDGEQGEPGENNYIHTAWATDPIGGNFDTSPFEGATWMGTTTTLSPDDPLDYSVYEWLYVKGDPGLTDEEHDELMDSIEDTQIIKDLVGLDGGQTFNKNRLSGPVLRIITKGESTDIQHNGDGYEIGNIITISADITCLIPEVVVWADRSRSETIPFVRQVTFDPTKLPAESGVTRAGVNGTRTYTWKVEIINGVETGDQTQETQSNYIAPINELYTQGTKQTSDFIINFTAENLIPTPMPITKSDIILNLVAQDVVLPVDPGDSLFTNARVVNFSEFGGSPSNTDNFGAFKSAINASVTEPLIIEIDAGIYNLQGTTNDRIQMEPWESAVSAGVRLVGLGNVVIRHKHNRTVNRHEYYFMQLAMSSGSLGFEVENTELDGIRNPQEELFYTQTESNPVTNIPLTRGFATTGAHNVRYKNVRFKNMYGGYAIQMTEYRDVHIQDVTFDKVGGNDQQESFGMAIYLGGHSGNAVVNIDNAQAQGMVTTKGLKLSWIGVVLENGSIQSSSPGVWMRDKNTTVNITNSSFMDYQSTFHVESMAGNVYWNVDNLTARGSNYQIVAGVYGEYKESSNNIKMEIMPYGRLWGIVHGLWYTEAQETDDNVSGHNRMDMYNSVIDLVTLPGFNNIPQAVSYGNSTKGYLHNTQLNDVPYKLVQNGSAYLYDSVINLAQGSTETRASLQTGMFSNGVQKVEFNNTEVNTYANRKDVTFSVKPAFVGNTGFVAPHISLPISPPI